jgi:S1-C subfamily serine protease
MYADRNIFERIVRIDLPDEKVATGMVIEHKSATFVVTARHALPDDSTTSIRVSTRAHAWDGVPALVPGINPKADIAVFSVPERFAQPALTIQLSSQGTIVSQDAFLFGFPYGLSIRQTNIAQLPFVKKATVSAVVHEPEDNTNLFMLDGIVNPGFSGGPVVIAPPGGLATATQVIGIVADYLEDYERLYIGEVANDEATVSINTGLITAYKIEHALEALDRI